MAWTTVLQAVAVTDSNCSQLPSPCLSPRPGAWMFSTPTRRAGLSGRRPFVFTDSEAGVPDVLSADDEGGCGWRATGGGHPLRPAGPGVPGHGLRPDKRPSQVRREKG
ncbi:hypothetical protein GCM10009733_059540 [Nonomuraea maheshkhaliensis]|uniref:Uncharacterized protein n=1 Tax=Nonomuraea maheshkhaliensis TaxID=419590 RepID=A0ABN2FMW9_9ACTN